MPPTPPRVTIVGQVAATGRKVCNYSQFRHPHGLSLLGNRACALPSRSLQHHTTHGKLKIDRCGTTANLILLRDFLFCGTARVPYPLVLVNWFNFRLVKKWKVRHCSQFCFHQGPSFLVQCACAIPTTSLQIEAKNMFFLETQKSKLVITLCIPEPKKRASLRRAKIAVPPRFVTFYIRFRRFHDRLSAQRDFGCRTAVHSREG